MKCSFKGCKENVRCSALCKKHYLAYRRSKLTTKIREKQYSAYYNKTPKRRFSRAMSAAKIHSKEWAISFVAYKRLIKNPCHYCNGNIDECGSGIDRVDNSLGYVSGNIVSCCGLCNRMKSSIPLELFILMICRIYKNMQSKL